jgi:hypothetical protein
MIEAAKKLLLSTLDSQKDTVYNSFLESSIDELHFLKKLLTDSVCINCKDNCTCPERGIIKSCKDFKKIINEG